MCVIEVIVITLGPGTNKNKSNRYLHWDPTAAETVSFYPKWRKIEK